MITSNFFMFFTFIVCVQSITMLQLANITNISTPISEQFQLNSVLRVPYPFNWRGINTTITCSPLAFLDVTQ